MKRSASEPGLSFWTVNLQVNTNVKATDTQKLLKPPDRQSIIDTTVVTRLIMEFTCICSGYFRGFYPCHCKPT